MPFEGPYLSRSTLAKRTHVQVLLAVLNGEAYLGAQLASLGRQSHRNWSLLASDDGSTDETLAVLQGLTAPSAVMHGPREGFAQNFLALLRASDTEAGFVAFCDQDDVWLPAKLERAVDALASCTDGGPAMYCGRTIHCDRTLNPIGTSPCFRRPPTFRNALWQNIGGGNTIVLNTAAHRLLAAASEDAMRIVSHDWWVYQTITAMGGRVIYDPVPQVLYRQHGGNAVGARQGPLAAARRIARLTDGAFSRWTDGNLAALRAQADRFTAENRQILRDYTALRMTRDMACGRKLARLGLYRQSAFETALFHAAFSLGRI